MAFRKDHRSLISPAGIGSIPFRLRFRHTLSFRVLFTATALCAIAIGALSFTYFQRQNRFLHQQISSRADSIALYLCSQVEYPLTTGDTFGVQQAAYHAFANTDILYIDVRDSSGKELVSVKRPEFTENIPQSSGHKPRLYPSFIDVARTIGAQEGAPDEAKPAESLGTVRVGYSTHQVAELRKESLEQTAILAVITIGILCGCMYLACRRLLSPLRDLTEFMGEIGQGGLNKRAPVVHSDEVGLLATSFNSMLADLSSTVVTRDYVDNILHSMAEALLVTNEKGLIKTVNKATQRLTGLSEAELLGKPISIAMDLDLSQDTPLISALGSSEQLMRSSNGATTPVLVSRAPLSGAGERGQVFLAQDISAQKATEHRLRVAQERYEVAVRGANDGLWDWDLNTGEMYLSPRWKEMLGMCPDEVADVPETWIDRLHPDDRGRVQREWEEHLNNQSAVFESEHRMLHNDGNYRWMLSRGMAVRTAEGQATRMAGSQTDITGNKSSDPLTGLANRLLFNERLSQLIREKRQGGIEDYAVLFLDVDRFKVVNDSLGHLAGDSLLRQIAGRLKDCVRSTDTVSRLFGDATVARLGGDEFAILIERLGKPENARAIANRVLSAFEGPFQIGEREIFASFSVGVAVGSPDYAMPEDIVRDADIAMYEAKVSGKARAEIFDQSMRSRAVERMELEGDLRTGLERGEFEVFYQPKIQMDSGKIYGFEALLRWNHPVRGLTQPSEFIPIAEETGLIVPLGYWVLRSACSQLKEWQRLRVKDSVSVSVNISARQFAEADLVEQVAGILQEFEIDPHLVELELTESVVMQNPVAATEILHRLKALGIGLNMDDFGTGYSSLSNLQRFPFDTIKVDRSFVASMDERVENHDLIKTILALAKNFGMKVVAEGIETEKQRSALQALGCLQGQGYLYSKPVVAASAGSMIVETRSLERSDTLQAVCLV